MLCWPLILVLRRSLSSDREYSAGPSPSCRAAGYIPEVAHTFGYHEETYGAMNEKQVGIGESTCSGVFGTKAAGHGGRALMSIDTLSQLAMERGALCGWNRTPSAPPRERRAHTAAIVHR